jgi:hypothetical protein
VAPRTLTGCAGYLAVDGPPGVGVAAACLATVVPPGLLRGCSIGEGDEASHMAVARTFTKPIPPPDDRGWLPIRATDQTSELPSCLRARRTTKRLAP